jgi:CDP-glycerol glycerophosphotransferase
MAKIKFSNSFLNACAELYRSSVRKFYGFICLISFIKKPNKKLWAFPVHYVQGTFSDNVFAVFEKVKSNPEIKKIIFTKKKNIELTGSVNVEFANVFSLKGLLRLSQCGVIFIQHTLLLDYALRWPFFAVALLKRSIGVNLWHGIAIKQIRASHPNPKDIEEHEHFKMVISSSKIDKLVMIAAFNPINPHRVSITGLPRNDFLLMNENELPTEYLSQLKVIEKNIGNKRLIIYAPTFRDSKTYYPFSNNEIYRLKNLLKEHNAVLGFRVHYFDFSTRNQFLALVDNELFFDFGQKVINDMNLLIRKSDLIITDYSSLYVDAMLLNKPMISFAYDLENYRDVERGFYYKFENVFPGNIYSNFNSTLDTLELFLQNKYTVNSDKYNSIKQLFFDFTDNRNSERVVAEVNRLIQKYD